MPGKTVGEVDPNLAAMPAFVRDLLLDKYERAPDPLAAMRKLTPEEAVKEAFEYEGVIGYHRNMREAFEWAFRMEGRIDLHRKM